MDGAVKRPESAFTEPHGWVVFHMPSETGDRANCTVEHVSTLPVAGVTVVPAAPASWVAQSAVLPRSARRTAPKRAREVETGKCMGWPFAGR